MYDENDYVGRKGAINTFFGRLFMDGWLMMLIDKVRGR
jgi:hypothetical protein